MFEILFYEDSNGNSEVVQFLHQLRAKAKSKRTDRINYEKIITYLKALNERGTKIGEPYIKQIAGEQLWQLNPLRHHILFFYQKENQYVLVHYCSRNTLRIPTHEIEKARQKMQDFLKTQRVRSFNEYFYNDEIVSPKEREIINLETDLIFKLIDTRQQTGMLQKELALRAGVKLSDISRIENLGFLPPINTIVRVLNSLGWTLKIMPLEQSEIF